MQTHYAHWDRHAKEGNPCKHPYVSAGCREVLIDALSPLGSLGNGVAGGEGAIYLWARLPQGKPLLACFGIPYASLSPPTERDWQLNVPIGCQHGYTLYFDIIMLHICSCSADCSLWDTR